MTPANAWVPPPLKNVLSSVDDQYTAPNNKYTGGEPPLPHPNPLKMEVSSTNAGECPHHLK